MGVTRQASAPITGGFVLQLEAEGQKEGEDALEKRLAIAEEVAVGGFASKIDRDGAVVAGPFGCCAHESPPGPQVSSVDETRWGEPVDISRPS